MNHKLLGVALAWCLCLLSGVVAAVEPKMDQVKDSRGIKVWTYEVPNYPIRAFKATVTVKSTLSALVALVLDTSNAGRWIYRTNRVEVLKRDDNAQTFLIRVETDFPMPLTDRDAIVAGSISQDPDTLVVSIYSHSEGLPEYPPVPGFIRMPDFEGLWHFTPLGDGMVEVTMWGKANPGGSIPTWVTNLVVQETPYNTLRGLQKLIGDERYQKAKVKQIREPAAAQ